MRKIFFFLILIYCSCNSNNPANKITELFTQALRTDSTDDLDSSIYYYSEIIKIDSTQWSAYELRSKAYVNTGQLDKAIKDLDKVVSQKPTATSYFYRASAYNDLSEYDKAEQDYKNALKANPSYGEAYYGLSGLENDRGHYKAALNLCDMADSKRYNETMSFYLRGQIYCGLGEYEKAIEAVKKLVTKEKRSANIGAYYNTIGFAENKLGRYNEALGHLSLSISLNSKSSAAFSNKAFALLKTGNVKDAMQFVEHSLELNPENPYAYNTRGQIFLAMKENDKACKDINKALSLSTDSILTGELNGLIKSKCKGMFTVEASEAIQ